MDNHSALLMMTMTTITVKIVQHYMVEGGGSRAAITVSLLVLILLKIHGMGYNGNIPGTVSHVKMKIQRMSCPKPQKEC